jgi:hypothetical protein
MCLTKHHAMRTYGGSRGRAPRILIRRGMFSFTPLRFTPGLAAFSTHWIGGWVCPRTALDAVAKRNVLIIVPALKYRYEMETCLKRKIYSCFFFPIRCKEVFFPTVELDEREWNEMKYWTAQQARQKTPTSIFTTVKTSDHTRRISMERWQCRRYISLNRHFNPARPPKRWLPTFMLYSGTSQRTDFGLQRRFIGVSSFETFRFLWPPDLCILFVCVSRVFAWSA